MVGNIGLRVTHHTHYIHNITAVQIGAVGGGITSTAVCFINLYCLRKPEEKSRTETMKLIAIYNVIFAALSGAIGTAILLRAKIDLGGIGILHGAWAGILGATICMPLVVLVWSLILDAGYSIYSPRLTVQKSVRSSYMRARHAIKEYHAIEEYRCSPSTCNCVTMHDKDPKTRKVRD